MRIVFFGVGAIGGTVGAWYVSKHQDCWFIDKSEITNKLKTIGLTVYQGDSKEKTLEHVTISIMEQLEDLNTADIIAIAVKNYNLGDVAKLIRSKIGNKEPIIISFANGNQNQSILPRYFKRVIYCVIAYNAWIDEIGVIGYQKRGPLLFGTIDNSLQPDLQQIITLFNPCVESMITYELQNAVHCKMALNLVNSVSTLVGFNYDGYKISNMDHFQDLVSNIIYEGILLLKAENFKECRLGGMPSWTLLKLSVTLPKFISRILFKKKAKAMVLTSMAQDILVFKRPSNELEDLNGYFITIADKHHMAVPYNRVVYRLCKEKFIHPQTFIPMDVSEVYSEVLKEIEIKL